MNATKITACMVASIAIQSVAFTQSDPAAGPYCGVYCFYAAIKAQGREVKLENLIDERYISSPIGSSLRDLKAAADDYEMFALPMRGMTSNMLRDSEHPVILHVRTARRGSPFVHWILYLGTEDGRARIIDPPNAPETMSFAEVMSRWDGVGMVISDQEISTGKAARLGWMDLGVFGMAATLTVLLAFAVSIVLLPQRAKALPTGLIGILCSGVALGVGYHGFASEGFLNNPESVAGVMTTHHAGHLVELSLDELTMAMNRKPVIIDARFGRDYEVGNIPGAVSIPISTTNSQRTRLLESIPYDSEVIVYCQSNTCLWSDELGSDLVFRGYENVSVYRGGYREWTEAAKR
jgi:rhodanese-related sulfurtransferase